MKKIVVSSLLLVAGFAHAAAIGTYGTTRAFDKFMATSTGTGAQTIKFSGSGVPLASAPTAAAVTLGNAGVVADSASKGLIVSGTATLPLAASGLVVPVAMIGKVSGADLAMAVGTLIGLSGGPVGFAAVALTLGIPMINKWLDSSGIQSGGPTGFQKRVIGFESVCFLTYSQNLDYGSFLSSYQGTGADGVANTVSAYGEIDASDRCAYGAYVGNMQYSGVMRVSKLLWSTVPKSATGTNKLDPIQLPEVLQLLPTSQPDPGVLKELFTIDQTGTYSDQTLKDLAITNVVASGPATVSGPSTLTSTAATPTAPATQTTTKTNYNCVYVMADVTCNQTATSTVQPVGIDPATNQPYAPTVTDTTTKPVDAPAPTPDPCKENPDRVGCAVLGTPPTSEAIPSLSVPVSLTPVMFAAPSGCPAPYTGSIDVLTFHKSWSIGFDSMCSLMTTLRLLFLAVGGAAAAWLFMEGLKV